MWIPILVLLILGAQLNLTALVPLQAGDPPPPWWVGGRLLWPFAVETRTLLPPGDALNTLTPILAIASAMCFLLAVAALLRRVARSVVPVVHRRRSGPLDSATGHLVL
jgi:hypothetical protein